MTSQGRLARQPLDCLFLHPLTSALPPPSLKILSCLSLSARTHVNCSPSTIPQDPFLSTSCRSLSPRTHVNCWTVLSSFSSASWRHFANCCITFSSVCQPVSFFSQLSTTTSTIFYYTCIRQHVCSRKPLCPFYLVHRWPLVPEFKSPHGVHILSLGVADVGYDPRFGFVHRHVFLNLEINVNHLINHSKFSIKIRQVE